MFHLVSQLSSAWTYLHVGLLQASCLRCVQ